MASSYEEETGRKLSYLGRLKLTPGTGKQYGEAACSPGNIVLRLWEAKS